MIQVKKLPIDRPNLHYERLMQFTDGVTTQRPNADLKDLFKVINKYLSITEMVDYFKLQQQSNEINIYSKISRQQLAVIGYAEVNGGLE